MRDTLLRHREGGDPPRRHRQLPRGHAGRAAWMGRAVHRPAARPSMRAVVAADGPRRRAGRDLPQRRHRLAQGGDGGTAGARHRPRRRAADVRWRSPANSARACCGTACWSPATRSPTSSSSSSSTRSGAVRRTARECPPLLRAVVTLLYDRAVPVGRLFLRLVDLLPMPSLRAQRIIAAAGDPDPGRHRRHRRDRARHRVRAWAARPGRSASPAASPRSRTPRCRSSTRPSSSATG